MAHYPTIYNDSSGKVKTSIQNKYNETGINCLYLEIDGVKFEGTSFDDFELINSSSYTNDQLKRFTFNKVRIYQSNEFAWELCSCRFEIHIPQIVVETEKETEIKTDLLIQLKLGNPKPNGGISELFATFNLTIDKKQFVSESNSTETALSQLQKELLPLYRFKNCFSCHYSDYSPIGSGFFASLMCFRNNKAAYLSANKKEDYFKLATEGYIGVQETYCCEQFAPREKDTGYRGWPFEPDFKSNPDI